MSLGGKYLSEGRNWLAWLRDHPEEPQQPIAPEPTRKPVGAPLAECISDDARRAMWAMQQRLKR